MDLVTDFGVADESPAPYIRELQGGLNTTWVKMWKGLEVRSRHCVSGCSQVEDLDKLPASTPFLSILKLLIVMSLAVALGIFCCEITTSSAPGGVCTPQERQRRLRASDRSERLAGPLRFRNYAQWLPALNERW